MSRSRKAKSTAAKPAKPAKVAVAAPIVETIVEPALAAPIAEPIVEPAAESVAVALPKAPAAVVEAVSSDSDVRGVLIQLVGSRLLLPNAAIAEVMSYAPPEPVADAPDWLLGRIRWRGWQLPLIAFARMAALGDETGGLGSKVVVLKSLAGDAKAPYFAILTQGFPRLVTVSRAGLLVDTDTGELPVGVQARVTLNEDDAFVPDLQVIERLISTALDRAA